MTKREAWTFILTLAAVFGMVLLLTFAVSSWTSSRAPQPALLVEIVELPGNRSVECIRHRHHARGVTCNWEAANAD